LFICASHEDVLEWFSVVEESLFLDDAYLVNKFNELEPDESVVTA
jgi:hypothetical protein